MDHPDWLDFLKQLKEAKAKIGKESDEEWFYRGHPSNTYKLLPGLYRMGNKSLSTTELWHIEADLFYEFRARAKVIHGANLSDWDILFYMQHHGVRTRLLDWTESFGIALYFALLNIKPGDTPCIWVMNPYKLNLHYHKIRDLYSPERLDDDEGNSYSDYLLNNHNEAFWWKEPLAIYPVRRVDRLTTQGGYFTIQGTDQRPLEEIVNKGKNIIAKVNLTPEAVAAGREFLDSAGINRYSVFPDLDGLAEFLNEKYFKPYDHA